jgi:hypothetical protein
VWVAVVWKRVEAEGVVYIVASSWILIYLTVIFVSVTAKRANLTRVFLCKNRWVVFASVVKMEKK